MIHYHGTPITPRSVLHDLAGRNFCVSYAAPGQVKTCHEIGQSVMLDNGAFTFWQKPGCIPNWPGYYGFCEEWLEYQTTWAVIPDVIDGTEEENDALLVEWYRRGLMGGSPVWHLNESLGRLERLACDYSRVCFGSSGAYAEVGSDAWHRRTEKAFNAISDGAGKVQAWVHMLRGMSLSGSHYPFSSVDSSDIAQNHHRPQNTARKMADRWDSQQCPARWIPVDQLEMEVVA